MTKAEYRTICKTKNIPKIKEKHYILLCTLSLLTAGDNIHLSALPLLIMLCCGQRQSRYLCGGAIMLWCAVSVVTSSFYIPYMAFVFIFVVADCMLPKDSFPPFYPAVFIFAAVKFYVLSFDFATQYKIVFLLEILSFFLVPSAIQSGEKLLRENGFITSSLQLADSAIALGITCLAVNGVKIWGVDLPLCILMSLCFYYGTKDNLPLAMVSMLVAVASMWQSENLPYLFAGIMIIGFASFSLLQRGYGGYFATFGVALGTSIAFISKFNSFIFTVTTSVALAACFILCRKNAPAKASATTDAVTENDYITLVNNVDRLGRAFRFLGNTVIDISNLMTKESAPKDVQNIVANEVCRRCSNNHICWQQHYSHTQTQFTICEKYTSKGKAYTFDSQFLSRCDKTEQLIKSFLSASKLVTTQRLLYQAGKHNQRLLQNQFLAMAGILQDIVRYSNSKGVANTAYTHTINSFLLAMGKRVHYCICWQNSNRCVISAVDYFTQSELERVKTKLESIYNTRFDVPIKETEGESMLYTFCEVPQYTVDFSTISKSRFANCGDICESITAGEYIYVILTDGMGTGSFAAAESRTAVAMLKSMLSAGISMQNAVDTANIALNLKGTGQSCVSLDILQINRYSGQSYMCKAGGANSFLISGGVSRLLSADSLPIGILKETKIAQLDFMLKNGDSVVLVSDGVKADKKDVQKLTLMSQKCTANEMAQQFIKGQNADDDTTAAVIKLTRIHHQ